MIIRIFTMLKSAKFRFLGIFKSITGWQKCYKKYYYIMYAENIIWPFFEAIAILCQEISRCQLHTILDSVYNKKVSRNIWRHIGFLLSF